MFRVFFLLWELLSFFSGLQSDIIDFIILFYSRISWQKRLLISESRQLSAAWLRKRLLVPILMQNPMKKTSKGSTSTKMSSSWCICLFIYGRAFDRSKIFYKSFLAFLMISVAFEPKLLTLIQCWENLKFDVSGLALHFFFNSEALCGNFVAHVANIRWNRHFFEPATFKLLLWLFPTDNFIWWWKMILKHLWDSLDLGKIVECIDSAKGYFGNSSAFRKV